MRGEEKAIASWLRARIDEGVQAREIGGFVRSRAELERATRAVTVAGRQAKALDDAPILAAEAASVETMHLAKELEFKTVAFMACDGSILPLGERIAGLGDDADLEEAYVTERQLFCVACTRARDRHIMIGAAPGSEHLDDLPCAAKP